MLSVNSYPRAYIDTCRTRVAAKVAAYRALIASASDQAAIEAFEPHFFNAMVLALDNWFLHRGRAIELKDGNPLNEVRMMCNSITTHNNILTADKTIRYDPAKSVVKYRLGDEIRLTEAEFFRLSAAFLDDIERKFGVDG